ncbi:unnamed protein product, partial [Iphiclides podalirius]
MSTTIDQKAYLQKYLGGPSAIKKKKKKKVVKGQGFKIIDDDLDFSKLRALDGDELDILDEGEDAPQIAGIIDERPDDVKKLEQFKTTSKWRVINQDDGFNSKLQVEEIKKDVKEVEKENELIFGKMYSDSEDEKQQDSDASPPRRKNKDDETRTATKITLNSKENSDSDLSPPRNRITRSPSKKTKYENITNYDSELSLPRSKKNDDRSKTGTNQSRNNSDSDLSPPRRRRSQSPSKDTKCDDTRSDSDLSPPRRKEKKGKTRKPSRWEQIDGDTSKRYRKKSPSSDSSPPRRDKRQKDVKTKTNTTNLSPRRSHRSENSAMCDSDTSPPSKSRKDASSRKRNRTPDSDLSPPRRKKQSPQRQAVNDSNSERRYPENKKRNWLETSREDRHKGHKGSHKYPEGRSRTKRGSDSDASPPRKAQSSRREERRNYQRSSDSPPPSNMKMAKTLEGKKAGLQDALQLRKENEAFRKREEEVFRKMTDEVSGRNAKAVSRSKRETSEERQKLREKAERQKELDDKYKKWSRGLKQIEAQEARVQEYIHEAAKPLARHKDDRDLEQNLKQIERAGDPMLQYIREKKVERGEIGPEKPQYKGNFPPNRFSIRPGYRWDGVDRSNGYEKKYFEQQSKKRAQEEEAYKWSTEDL